MNVSKGWCRASEDKAGAVLLIGRLVGVRLISIRSDIEDLVGCVEIEVMDHPEDSRTGA